MFRLAEEHRESGGLLADCADEQEPGEGGAGLPWPAGKLRPQDGQLRTGLAAGWARQARGGAIGPGVGQHGQFANRRTLRWAGLTMIAVQHHAQLVAARGQASWQVEAVGVTIDCAGLPVVGRQGPF
ncbi:MAG: hypothetical protein KatS3mg061_3086 [Dehalococcoidia bacterium]|nr:MAG: hypothetical protein KatS3mg061_3086 [Dehalococcoidia bacterium]